jgi:catechol-2,3-dioxygenase
MITFYTTFLGGILVHRNAFIAFITYDTEHHRIALLNVPETQPKDAQTCGLEHIAFTFASLDDLADSYLQRKKLGMEPFWCVNHGMTTSMYYKDPDGNAVEAQVDNMGPEEATMFMMSKEFGENSIGVDFDPEVLLRRLRDGEDREMIMKRVEVGPRTLSSVMLGSI